MNFCSTRRMNRQRYPSDVSDEEWALVAPYWTLMREDAPQRDNRLREGFNGQCWISRTGAHWRMIPTDPAAVGDDLSASTAVAESRGVRGDGA
jgi:hypothetical protein